MEDFLATPNVLVKIDEGQQKIKIVRQPTIKFKDFLPINFLPLSAYVCFDWNIPEKTLDQITNHRQN